MERICADLVRERDGLLEALKDAKIQGQKEVQSLIALLIRSQKLPSQAMRAEKMVSPFSEFLTPVTNFPDCGSSFSSRVLGGAGCNVADRVYPDGTGPCRGTHAISLQIRTESAYC